MPVALPAPVIVKSSPLSVIVNTSDASKVPVIVASHFSLAEEDDAAPPCMFVVPTVMSPTTVLATANPFGPAPVPAMAVIVTTLPTAAAV